MDKTELFTCKANHFLKDRPCPGGCSFDDKGERFTCAPATNGAAAPAAGALAPVAKPVTRKPTAKAVKPPPKLVAKPKAQH